MILLRSRIICSLVFALLLSASLPAIAQGTAGRTDYGGQAKKYVIGNLSTEGLRSLSGQLLINTTGLQPGDSIVVPSDRLSSVTRRLMDQRHFSDVQTKTAFRGDTIDIIFVFDERQRVKKWEYSGTKGSEAKDLQEKLNLRRSGEFSDFIVMNAVDKIKAFYDEKGFRNAEIEVIVTPDSLMDNFVNVVFAISRKKKVRIGNIVIEGNKNIESKKLIRSFEKTKKVSINFFNDTKFNATNFEDDKEKLVALYRTNGYRDAAIVDDSLFKIKDNRIGIWIKVEEGKKYYLGDLSWLGNAKFPTENLKMMIGLKRGDVYDSETLGRRLGSIMGQMGEQSVASLYRDDGYLAFAIEPIERVRGDTVDVEVRIVEGKQFHINEVNFEGNTRTNDHVIRRELETRPGDLYSQTLLIRTYQRLAQMGQFDAESFATPSVNPNFQNNTVDIGYQLKEVSKDQFELSGGWGGGMFIASVGVNFTNISLRKFFDPKSWRPYPAGDNQTIAIKFQSNGTYYTAGSISFTEPWLGGKKPTSLSVSFYTSRETNADYWGKNVTGYFGTIGGSVGIGKRLNWPDPFFYMQFGATFQTYNLNNWNYFLIKNGSSNVFALQFSFGRNSIDDPVGYATRGSDISLSLSITPPYSLWDGVDYTQRLTDNQRYQWIEYHKWKFNARWFFPLTPDSKLVLMVRAQLGYLGSFNKNKPSPFEGFQVGGDGLAGYNIYGVETVGLRGYSNNSLTPYSGYGIYASIYSKFTAELRYPIVKTGGTLVYGLIFAEAGNAFQSVQEYKPFSLKRAAGVGVRIFLPVLGMLGVDWGYGFDPTPENPGRPSGSQFHFTMGMQM